MKIFITGKPGCGKSTLVKDIIEEMGEVPLSGIVTPEIRNGGRRGLEIIDMVSGEKRTLASVETKEGPRVGRYGVNVRGIDEVGDVFYNSFPGAEVDFIDEVGSMEFKSEKFKAMLEEVLNSDKTVVATLHRNLVKEFIDRGKVFELTRENFASTKKAVLEEVKRGGYALRGPLNKGRKLV